MNYKQVNNQTDTGRRR